MPFPRRPWPQTSAPSLPHAVPSIGSGLGRGWEDRGRGAEVGRPTKADTAFGLAAADGNALARSEEDHTVQDQLPAGNLIFIVERSHHPK